jgi:hypothetical protein
MIAALHATETHERIMHFFLDFLRKEPYKGDTTALSHEWREF